MVRRHAFGLACYRTALRRDGANVRVDTKIGNWLSPASGWGIKWNMVVEVSKMKPSEQDTHANGTCNDIASAAPTLDEQGNRSNPEVVPESSTERGNAPQAVTRRMADVEAKSVEWLWKHWVPKGALTTMDGDPGLGKSTITADLAARVSRGGEMPPGGGNKQVCDPAGVLLLSAEDDPSRTIRPRLEAAGADLGRVHILDAILADGLERPPVLPDDLPLIEQKVNENQVALVVIDPLMAYLSGSIDAHKDQHVRRCMHRLKMMAERTQAAVLVVRHLNKGVSGPAMYRGGGSIGILGAARSALLVGRHPKDQGKCVFASIKCNLAAPTKPLTYGHEPQGEVSRVVWGEEVDLTPEDILQPVGGQVKQYKPEQCAEAIKTLLAGGDMKSEEFEKKCKQKGFSERAIKEARKALGIKPKKDSMTGEWTVTLPTGREERGEADGEDEGEQKGDSL